MFDGQVGFTQGIEPIGETLQLDGVSRLESRRSFERSSRPGFHRRRRARTAEGGVSLSQFDQETRVWIRLLRRFIENFESRLRLVGLQIELREVLVAGEG